MTSKRIYYAMCGLLVLLVLAIGGGVWLANRQLQSQADKLVGLKTQHLVLQQEQAGLTKANKDITKYEALDSIAKTIVPQDKDQARAVREIVNIAADSGIKPTSITFPVSTLGATSSGTSTSVGSGASINATPTSPAYNSKQALSQLIPVKGIPGVYTLQITIQQDAASPVEYSKFVDFLSKLEQNRRTAQVSAIVLQPSPTNRQQVSFSLTVNEYIKP